MSDLRTDVRRRLRMAELRKGLGDRYEGRQSSHAGAVAGKNLVSIQGQTYKAALDEDLAVGARVEVVNAGRPAQAQYIAKSGGGMVVVGGGGGGGGGGGEPGSGLSIDEILALVDETRGLSVVSGEFGVDLASSSGLEFDSNGALRMEMGAGATLTATTTNALNATGHTHAVTALDNVGSPAATALLKATSGNLTLAALGLYGNLSFQGADRTITASDDLTLQPDDDLWLNPGGLIMLPDDQEMRTATIQDLPTGIKGVRLWERSDAVNYWQLTMGAIKIDELYARVFVADEVRIDRGEEYWSKSYGIVESDFVLPAIGATVDVWFEDAPALAGANLFSANDWLLFRVIDWGTGLVIMKCWFQVDSLQQADTDNDRQLWRLTRKKFGTTGVTVKKGNTALDAGQPGQGWLHLSALVQDGGPFFQLGIFTEVIADEPQFEPYVRMGNLNGTVDYATDAWGLVAGNNLGTHPDAGFSGFAADSDTGLRLFNTDLHLYETDTLALAVSKDYGISILNDSALFGNELRAISWYDDLGDIAAGFATARMSAWGDSSDRRLQLNSFGTDLSAIFLEASGDGGSEVVNVAIKAGGWGSQVGGIVDMVAKNARVIGGGARLMVGGSTSQYAESTVHVYQADSQVGDPAGLTVEQGGSGDARVRWGLSLGQEFVAGIDNSDGDKFKISVGGALGVGDAIIIDPSTGAVTINGLDSGSVATGLIAGDGINLAGAEISVDTTVVRTGRSVNAGDGLQGGGNLSSDRSLAVDSSVVRTTRQVNTSGGLTGGGALSSNLSLSLLLATVSGLNQTAGLALDDSVAGDGLDISSKVLAVDVTDIIDTMFGMEESSNNIRIKRDTNSGLTFGAAGGLALGTPDNVSATSTNSVSSTSHAHAVLASSDVSAGVASLLKSTSAGGLGLASLTVGGAATVGQSLSAGNSGFNVNYHTHDYNHVHVAINRLEADEQFGLDIDDNLLVRGWIVGKHATQMEGAKMLVHFDGQPPLETNWTGNPAGHMGQVATVTGTPAYYAGVFEGGKAIGITDGGTNLVRNPTLGNGLTTYTGPASLSSVRAFVGTQSAFYSGVGAAHVLRSGGYTMNVGAGQKAYLSAWVFCRVAGMARLHASGTWGDAVGAVNLTTNKWELIAVAWENTTGATQDVRIGIDTVATGTLWMDALSLTVDEPCVFASGEMTNGTWTGTAHNSSTTVASAYVSYLDSTIVSNARGTVACWFRLPWGNNHELAPASTLWSVGADLNFKVSKVGANPAWDLYMGGVSQIQFRPDQNGGETTDWHYLAVTYDVSLNSSIVYLNGTQIASGAAATFTTGSLSVGHHGGAAALNGYIDDVSIFDRVLSGDEIRAIYESNAPVFAETSTWHWRSGRNRVYADAEGLWGVGASGGKILGLYAGEDNNPSATKSWGGLSLSEGDFMLGHYGVAGSDAWSGGGWMLFDQDLVSGKPALRFGYAAKDVFRFDSGGASLYGVLDIDTNGGIYQGTGNAGETDPAAKFSNPGTGLKIYNSGGTGKISGYNSGVEQWYANTDGKLYAGGGNVVLDSNGIRIAAGAGLVDDVTGFGSTNMLSWHVGGVRAGGLGLTNDSGLHQMVLGMNSGLLTMISGLLGEGGQINLSSDGGVDIFAPDGLTLSNSLIGLPAINITSDITLTGGLSTSGNITSAGTISASQASTTAAIPCLHMFQADVSEPFIVFAGTTGAANAISNAALGAYYRKLRVSINGTIGWIPVYS